MGRSKFVDKESTFGVKKHALVPRYAPQYPWAFTRTFSIWARTGAAAADGPFYPEPRTMELDPAIDEMSMFMQSVMLNKQVPSAPMDNRKTKIVCTIGPVSQSVESLTQLLKAGMNVVRMNCSHGNHDFHLKTMQNAREAAKLSRCPVAILLDTKGPEVRTTKLKKHKPVVLKKGQKLQIRPVEDVLFEGDENVLGCDYLNLGNVVKKGDMIKIDDGLITCLVTSAGKEAVETIVQNGGEVGENKGVNLPNVVVDLPAMTKKDESDLLFGRDNGIDFIAASFVRKAQDIIDIRTLLGEKGAHIKIISKIENVEGLDNFDEILDVSDGIMVARGDLGVEIPIQKVCMAQKTMIRKCYIAGKPVITATQMLESMVKNPRPTRAEATDVSNAVFDGTDCVMLSGETAKGSYPVEAVRTMARLCRTTELAIDYHSMSKVVLDYVPRPLQRAESVSAASVKCARDMDAAIIIVLTQSGDSARYVAKHMPSVPVLTLTPSKSVYRQCLVSRCLFPVLSDASHSDEKQIESALSLAKSKGWVETDDWIVIVSGTQGIQGSSHTLKIIRVQ